MSIGIDGISSIYNQANTSAMNSKTNALQNTLDGDLSSATDEKLMSVCKEFEAYFVEQVMKEVEKTLPKTEDEDGVMSQMTDYYKEQVIQDLSEQVCDQNKLGLAQQMYEQMKRNYEL